MAGLREKEAASAGNAAEFCVQYQDQPLEREKKPHLCSRKKPAGSMALRSAVPGLGELSRVPAPSHPHLYVP